MPGKQTNPDCRRCGRPVTCCSHAATRERDAVELLKVLAARHELDVRRGASLDVLAGMAVQTVDVLYAELDKA